MALVLSLKKEKKIKLVKTLGPLETHCAFHSSLRKNSRTVVT